MNRNNIWLPLIASIGVGAATFYSMNKNNQDVGKTIQQFMPSNNQNGSMSNNSNFESDSGMLGPYGMS